MPRRFDPERRDRIIDAAMECIAASGVVGTSTRAVAARCDVPLGSMTYHFSSMDELLFEAFGRYTSRRCDSANARFAKATDRETAIEAVLVLVHEDFQIDPRYHLVACELAAIAARNPRFRPLVRDLDDAVLTALSGHFSEDTAHAIATYMEGAAMRLALGIQPQTIERTRTALRRIGGLGVPPLC